MTIRDDLVIIAKKKFTLGRGPDGSPWAIKNGEDLRDHGSTGSVRKASLQCPALTEAAEACRAPATLGLAPEAAADVDLVMEESA